MNVLEKIKELAAQHKISLAELERRTGISSGSITKWGKSSPSIDKIEKIARFFGVSTDYLIGMEDKSNSEDDLVFYRMNLDGLSEEEIAEVKRQIEIAEEIAIRNIRNKK